MVKKAYLRTLEALSQGQPEHIDCACLIHGTGYEWQYVDRLYNMLCRNLTPEVRLHVFTESTRLVPAPYIKHSLTDWGLSGKKKSWWYKMQLFNNDHHSGPILYFDLDVVVVKNIDWIWQLPINRFWTIRDFKYLWRQQHSGINSSVMWWDTNLHHQIWHHFSRADIAQIIRKFPGDQDYLSSVLFAPNLRYFDLDKIQSWRWQCLDGGFDFRTRKWATPGTGTTIAPETSVLVFHGHPKPHETQDTVIVQHWQ